MAGGTDMGQHYLDRFAAVRGDLPGRDLAWLDALRIRAIERFAALGFPHRKMEAWRYTSLEALRNTDFAPATGAPNGIDARQLAARAPGLAGAHLLVFVDGGFRADLSAPGAPPEGVELMSLGQALDSAPELLEAALGDPAAMDGGALWALNTAFMADGAVLRLGRGAMPEAPIHLLHLATERAEPHVIQPRNLILAEEGSVATVLESYLGIGEGTYWTNAATQVAVAPGAVLRHYKIQDEGPGAYHIGANRLTLGAGAAYTGFVLATGARLGREEIDAELGGEAVACRLDGVYLGRGRQQLDTITRVNHAEPGSRCTETYKGVLDERAHAVFQGLITVAKDAQKTDAHMLNQTLLLSDEARIDTKPELEILADDVQCSHGATVGDLDRDALFYLRARGLDERQARGLLIAAFVGEMMEAVEAAPVRDHMKRIVAGWLPAAADGRVAA